MRSAVTLICAKNISKNSCVFLTRIISILECYSSDVYRQYRDSGWSKKIYAQHESEIIIHKAAKKAFDELGLKKLPTMKTLQTEYATLAAEKKKLWQSYHADKDEMVALLMAKQNVDRILGMTPQTQKSRENSRDDR